MGKIADWTEEKKAEFAKRWADPEEKHLPELCAEFGLTHRAAVWHFGPGTLRKYPRKLSPEQWKELKKRWYSPFGGTSKEIVSKFGLSVNAMKRHLPKITVARSGRGATGLSAVLSSEQLKELQTTIETAEFTTFSALTRKYPGVSLRMLTRCFGSPLEIKRRVVAIDCPASMSKTQYATAKRIWADPDSGTVLDISKAIGLHPSTLRSAIGTRRAFRNKVLLEAIDAWYSDPLQNVKILAKKFKVPYRVLLDALPTGDRRYAVLNPHLYDAICDWFEAPEQSIKNCAKKNGTSLRLLSLCLPDKEERKRYKAQILDLKSLNKR
ncbi:MAG: hypothetical protein ACFHHU_00465 [Porticoccaceae bacterium]